VVNSPNSQFRLNRLLAALPTEEYQRLLPSLESVSLQLKDELYEENEPIEYVYFPTSGMASILVVMADGALIEAGIVGNEGMVGLAVFLGTDKTATRAFYQVVGNAVRMRSDLFRQEIKQDGALTSILQRYTQAYLAMLAQNVGCNSHHPVQERCARWLLLTHDRIGNDQFVLTQEFISEMLGVRRAGVSIAMQTLQKAGFVHYSRGTITIVNRAGLESAACECYGIITAEYARMLG
jgi:CRP-like cAMP-binding protein